MSEIEYMYSDDINNLNIRNSSSHEENQEHTQDPSVFHPSRKESGRDDETGA